MQDPTPLKEAGSKEAEILALASKIATAEATFRAQAFATNQSEEVKQEDMDMTFLLAGLVTDLLTRLLEAYNLPIYVED